MVPQDEPLLQDGDRPSPPLTWRDLPQILAMAIVAVLLCTVIYLDHVRIPASIETCEGPNLFSDDCGKGY